MDCIVCGATVINNLESFRSAAHSCNLIESDLFNSNFKSQFCFSEKIDSPKLTSRSELRVVDVSQIYAIRQPLQFKLQEPILLLGKDRFSEVDITIRVKGGGRISQNFAIRQPLQFKLQEPILLLGKDRFSEIDIRIRVKGGGRISQIYAIRQTDVKL